MSSAGVATLLAILVSSGLAGCGDASSAAEREREIVIASPFGDELAGALQQVGDRFAAQRDSVSVQTSVPSRSTKRGHWDSRASSVEPAKVSAPLVWEMYIGQVVEGR